MELTGVKQQRRHRVMILGGGLVGARLAELLGKAFKVTLLEKDARRAEELSSSLKDTVVLHGDGSDKEVLEEAGLKDIDTFIASTGDNEANIMSCILAKHLMAAHDIEMQGVGRKTICLVTKEEYLVLASTSGLDIVMNKKLLAGNEILTFIRGSELLSISHMHGFDAEVIDIIAAPNAPITKKILAKQTKALAGHIIIGSVFRDGEWKTAVGDTHIHGGDRAIVICNSLYLKEVRRLFSA